MSPPTHTHTHTHTHARIYPTRHIYRPVLWEMGPCSYSDWPRLPHWSQQYSTRISYPGSAWGWQWSTRSLCSSVLW